MFCCTIWLSIHSLEKLVLQGTALACCFSALKFTYDGYGGYIDYISLPFVVDSRVCLVSSPRIR